MLLRLLTVAGRHSRPNLNQKRVSIALNTSIYYSSRSIYGTADNRTKGEEEIETDEDGKKDSTIVFSLGSLIGAQQRRHIGLNDETYNLDVDVATLKNTLQELRKSGYKLSLCSSLPTPVVNKVMEKMTLLQYFNVGGIVGSDILPVVKPDPGHLIYTVEVGAGGETSKCIVVGSSVVDAQLARAAGVSCIIIVSDDEMRGKLAPYRVEMLIADINELPDALEQLQDKSMY